MWTHTLPPPQFRSPSAMRMSVRVKPGPRGVSATRPLRGRKRNSKRHSMMSQSCQQRSSTAHSIISSAATSRPGGTVRPSAFAVLRLITVSYLVSTCTGRSAGLAPRRDAVDKGCRLSKLIDGVDPVGHETTGRDEETPCVNRRQAGPRGREPRTLYRPSDGGGSHPTANIPGDFAPDRGTATAAATSAGVRRPIVMRSRTTDGRIASKC
jgi:hypothetical protein